MRRSLLPSHARALLEHLRASLPRAAAVSALSQSRGVSARRAAALCRLLCIIACTLAAQRAFAADGQAPSPPAPAGIAVDSDGNVYVSDYAFDRIVKFAPDGSIQTQWGGSGA